MGMEGVQSPFSKDGPFAGKSEKEVADLVTLQDLTIKEQKVTVDGIGSEPAPVAKPEPEPEPVKISSEDFFLDPAEAIRKVTSETIQGQMKEIVSELRQNFAEGRTKTAWEEAAGSISNLDSMRPLIEARLKQNGVSNPNTASIIAVNDMLVGEAQRQGAPIPGMGADPDPKPKPAENERMIPQHNVSTQPLVQTDKKETFEPLDENEARMAREQKISHENFRKLQAIDGEDVLLPEPETAS